VDIEEKEEASEPMHLDYASQERQQCDPPRSVWWYIGAIISGIIGLLVLSAVIYGALFIYTITHLAP